MSCAVLHPIAYVSGVPAVKRSLKHHYNFLCSWLPCKRFKQRLSRTRNSTFQSRNCTYAMDYNLRNEQICTNNQCPKHSELEMMS